MNVSFPLGTLGTPLRNFHRSPRAHLIFLFLLSIVVSMMYGIGNQPFLLDRSYHVYMGQVIHRGNILYGSATYGYTPYGPMVMAAVMFAGDIVHVPTFIAPRYAAVLLNSLNCCLVYLFVLRATDRKITAFIGGLISGSFGFISMLAVTDLEPKLMVSSLMIVAMLLLQWRRWLLVGLACSAATMFWQPAVLIAFVMFYILLAQGRTELVSRVAKFMIGVIIGVLPAIAYLTITNGWNDFYVQTVILKAERNLRIPYSQMFKWIFGAFGYFWSEAAILFLGGIGVYKKIVGLIGTGYSSHWREAANPLQGGLLLLTFSWPFFLAIDYEKVSLIPLVLLIGIWASFVVTDLLEYGLKKLVVNGDRNPGSKSRTIKIATILFLSLYLYSDAIIYRATYTLDDQRALVLEIVGSEHLAGSFLAINAEEFYVLTDTQSPIKHPRIENWNSSQISATEPGGTDGFIMRLKDRLPPLVIVRRNSGLRSIVLNRIIDQLLVKYEISVIHIPCEHSLYFALPQLIFESHERCANDLMIFRRSGPAETPILETETIGGRTP